MSLCTLDAARHFLRPKRIDDLDTLEVLFIVGANDAVVCFDNSRDNRVECASGTTARFAVGHRFGPSKTGLLIEGKHPAGKQCLRTFWPCEGTVRVNDLARPRSYTAAMPTARALTTTAIAFLRRSSGMRFGLFPVPLSLRMVEEMLAARGTCVTYETVRQWGRKFGKASLIRSAGAPPPAAINGIWMRSSCFRRASPERAFAVWSEISKTGARPDSRLSENRVLQLSARLT